MIARAASGSFRDALGTLDQLVAFGGEKVGLDDVLEMLGAADAELLFGAVDAVIADDPKGVLLGVEKMARSGRDPAQFARDLLAHLRHLLVTQTIGEVPDTFVVTATDEGRLTAQAQAIGAATLVRTIDELAAALTAVREGDDAGWRSRSRCLKAARPDIDPSAEGLLRRVERLEKGMGGGGPRVLSRITGALRAKLSSTPAPPPPAGSHRPAGRFRRRPPRSPADDPAAGAKRRRPTRGQDASPQPPPTRRARQPAADRGRGRPCPGRDQQIWPAVIEKLRETVRRWRRPSTGRGRSRSATRGCEIGFPAELDLQQAQGRGEDKREQMSEALVAVTGAQLRPVYVLLDGEDGRAEGAAGRGGRRPRGAGREAEERIQRRGGRLRRRRGKAACPGASTSTP